MSQSLLQAVEQARAETATDSQATRMSSTSIVKDSRLAKFNITTLTLSRVVAFICPDRTIRYMPKPQFRCVELFPEDHQAVDAHLQKLKKCSTCELYFQLDRFSPDYIPDETRPGICGGCVKIINQWHIIAAHHRPASAIQP